MTIYIPNNILYFILGVYFTGYILTAIYLKKDFLEDLEGETFLNQVRIFFQYFIIIIPSYPLYLAIGLYLYLTDKD